MEPAELNAAVIGDDAELRKVVNDLHNIGERFAWSFGPEIASRERFGEGVPHVVGPS